MYSQENKILFFIHSNYLKSWTTSSFCSMKTFIYTLYMEKFRLVSPTSQIAYSRMFWSLASHIITWHNHWHLAESCGIRLNSRRPLSALTSFSRTDTSRGCLVIRAVSWCRALRGRVDPVAYRGGGLGCSNPLPPKFRRYRWSPRSHEQEEPASRFPFAVHCVLMRL